MRKFADVGHIQLLLHPSEQKIAIRPCEENSMHSIKWHPDTAKSLYAKTLCFQHFGTALFRIMNWNPDFIYRVRGTWLHHDDEQIIIYNLENAVSAVLLPQAEEAARPKKRTELLPERWADTFGEEFYDHIMENNLFYIAERSSWQARRSSIPAPGIEQYAIPTEKEIQMMIETLTGKAGSSNAG